MDPVANAILEVEAAFQDVRHPGEAEMLHPLCVGEHEADVGVLRGYSAWQAIPDQVIEAEIAGLTPLSAAAFQFYLPAYMRWSLLNFQKTPAFTSDATVSLAPNPARPKYSTSRYVLFSPAQVHAVVSFLNVMATSPVSADAEVAQEALRSYWLPRLGGE